MNRRNQASKDYKDISRAHQKGSEWVVAGDASRFLIFQREENHSLRLLKAFSNAASHLKTSDLERDQPGRSFASTSQSHGGHQTGSPRHALGSEQDPKAHALEVFVSGVCEFLENARKQNSFQKLVLVADDRLLGQLRSSLNEHTSALISQVHAKDLAWISGAELEKRVESLLE